MAHDSRSAYDLALGVPPDDYDMPFARHKAITARIAEAPQARNWTAAQVCALLLIAEQMPGQTVSVQWDGWEDHANAVGYAVGQALGR